MLKRNYWELINFPDSPELWVESEMNEKEKEMGKLKDFLQGEEDQGRPGFVEDFRQIDDFCPPDDVLELSQWWRRSPRPKPQTELDVPF